MIHLNFLHVLLKFIFRTSKHGGFNDESQTDHSAQPPPAQTTVRASISLVIFIMLSFVLVLLLGVAFATPVANFLISPNNTHPLETNTDTRNESFSSIQPNANGLVTGIMTETCDDLWIKPDIYGLSTSLNQKIIGQDLATTSILSGLGEFVHPRQSVKARPLLLHMIGPKGLGKRTVAHLIADHLYHEGYNSQFVHVLDAEKHVTFQTTDQVIRWIRGNVSSCGRSMFIFENRENGTEKYGSRSILDHVLEDLIKENSQQSPSIDFTRSVFVYIWNIGFEDEIVQSIKERLMAGVSLDELMRVIMEWINNGMKLLSHESIFNLVIPFLPIECHSVKQYLFYHWKAKA